MTEMIFGASYFGNRILRYVEQDMRALRRDQFDYVVHTFSEFDLLFHRQNMADIVRLSQDSGLKVYLNPWGIGNVFGGEPFSNFVSQQYRDACQILDDGQTVPMACPNAPAFRDYMRQWVEAAAAMQPDGIFWDEPHFHEQGFLSSVAGRWGCRCDHCRRKFKKLFGYAMPRQENADVIRFKRQSIRDLVSQLSRAIAGSEMRNILFLTANIEPENIPEAWSQYARMAAVDTLATGPYWRWHGRPLESVRTYSENLARLCKTNQKSSQLWIQCCKIPAGYESEIATAAGMAAASGIRDIAFWGFEGCGHESWIACENPAACWQQALQSIVNSSNSPQ